MIALSWNHGPGVFLLAFATVMGSISLGLLLGRYRRRRVGDAGGEGVGSVVASVLGLLAFLLAFTFGLAANRYDARRKLLLDDVNAIRRTAQRAELLPEPHASEVRALLGRYVDLRASIGPQTMRTDLMARMAESERLQAELWKHARALREAGYDTDIGALFVESVNDLIDAHTSRATVAMLYRIPLRIWGGLCLITVCAMLLLGYQFGLAGRNNLVVQTVLAVGFATVVALIADLDQPDGAVRVDQRPMVLLQRQLAAPAP